MDGTTEKIRLDLKNKKIIWILPWIKLIENENWISDKVRFSYDGFDSNKVVNFYIKNKLIFIPLFCMFMIIQDPLNQIFFKNLKITKLLKIQGTFKSSRNSFFQYYFSKFNFQKNLISLHSNELSLNFVNLKFNNSILNFWTASSKKIFKNFLLKIHSLLNNYLFKWISKFNFNNKIYLNILKSVVKIEPNTLLKSILINLLDDSIHKHNILPGVTNDLIMNQTLSLFHKANNTKKILQKTRIFLPDLETNYLSDFTFYNNIPDNINFSNYDLVLSFNSNLRLSAPKIFLSLWKLKKKYVKLISFGDHNFTSNFFLNFGFKLKHVLSILSFKNWINSFFLKKKQIGFIIGNKIANNFSFDSFFNLIKKSLIYTFKFFFLSKFFFQNSLILPKILTFNYWFHKIYDTPSHNFQGFFSSKLLTNTKFYLISKNKNILKKKIGSTLYSNFSNWNTLSSKFIINELHESNFHFLYESNMPNLLNLNNWDIILPVTNTLGFTSVYKSYSNNLLKSLFVKHSSNFSKTNYSYVIALNCLLSYPSFILNCNINNKNFILKILLGFIFKSYFNFKILNKIKIKLKIIHLNFIKKKLIKLKYNNFINFSETNFWFSKNVHVLSSKYSSFGYNMVSKKNQTFNIN